MSDANQGIQDSHLALMGGVKIGGFAMPDNSARKEIDKIQNNAL